MYLLHAMYVLSERTVDRLLYDQLGTGTIVLFKRRPGSPPNWRILQGNDGFCHYSFLRFGGETGRRLNKTIVPVQSWSSNT